MIVPGCVIGATIANAGVERKAAVLFAGLRAILWPVQQQEPLPG
jgi:hypothetical protein